MSHNKKKKLASSRIQYNILVRQSAYPPLLRAKGGQMDKDQSVIGRVISYHWEEPKKMQIAVQQPSQPRHPSRRVDS